MLNKGSPWIWRTLGLGAALTLLLSVAPGSAEPTARNTRWRPPPPAFASVTVSLEDEAGRPLRSFVHGGQTFVLGEVGRRYNIRVVNPQDRRIEAVVSVDGRDVIDGSRADFVRSRGYVIGPRDSVVIEGFRTSLDEVAAFRFSDPEDSYSSRRGTPEHVGVIGVALFGERVQQVPAPRVAKRDGAPRTESSREPARGGAAPSGTRAPRNKARNLGTEFGEARRSRVVEVPFERATPSRPARVITLRYDDAAGLEARGIDVFREPRRTAVVEPDPFPGRRFAPPP